MCLFENSSEQERLWSKKEGKNSEIFYQKAINLNEEINLNSAKRTARSIEHSYQ